LASLIASNFAGSLAVFEELIRTLVKPGCPVQDQILLGALEDALGRLKV
jgi:hypothetical protein